MQQIVSGDVSVTTSGTWDVPGPTGSGTRIFTRAGAATDTEISGGGVVATVNERPVFLIESSVPFYRLLTVGDSGRDVQALQEGLEQLGYGLSSDKLGTYGAATARAVFYLYRDREYQPVDAEAQPVSLAIAATTVVPLGEVFAAPTLPLRSVDGCGDIGQTVLQYACVLQNDDYVITMSVSSSDAANIKAGHPVTVTLSDGSTTAATVEGRLITSSTIGGNDPTSSDSSSPSTATPVAPTSSPTSDAAGLAGTSTTTFTLNSGSQFNAGVKGSANVIVASSPEASLHVPAIAIHTDAGKFWLLTPTSKRVPVTVGLCATGSCTVVGPTLSSGMKVRLPDVYGN